MIMAVENVGWSHTPKLYLIMISNLMFRISCYKMLLEIKLNNKHTEHLKIFYMKKIAMF